MGTALTGTTPQDTYDSLIKVTDNGPLSGSLKVLTDGLGNNSTLSLSTAAASIAGTLAVTGVTTLSSTISAVSLTTSGNNTLNNSGGRAIDATSSGVLLASSTAAHDVIFGDNNVRYFSLHTPSGAASMSIRNFSTSTNILTCLQAGNVGIGTTAPLAKLTVSDGTNALFVSHDANGPYISSANNANTVYKRQTYDAIDHVFAISASERARITTNGLTFNGDTAAANALDDYEEGTWTPSVLFGGAAVGLTYNRRGGTYTKIGRQVTICADLILSLKGSSTGNATIAGLPFTIGATTDFLQAVSFRFSSMSFLGLVQGYGGVGSTIINMEQVLTGAGAVAITHADFQDGTQIMVSLTYFV